MGMAIQAVTDAYKLIEHNPVILGIGWVATIAVFVLNFVLGFIPLIGRIISLFVWPVFLAGLLALIYAGRNGNASMGDFTDGISEHYVPLLGATLILGVGFFVLFFGLTIVSAFVIGFGGSLGSDPSAMLGAALIPVLVIFGLFALLAFLLQFFDVAIVADDAGVFGAFSKSLGVFKTAPLSALGYSVLRAIIVGGIMFLPLALFVTVIAGGSMATTPMGSGMSSSASDALGLSALIFFALWGLLLVPLGQVIGYTYHVAFYNRVTSAS
jgi:hypothetical protein